MLNSTHPTFHASFFETGFTQPMEDNLLETSNMMTKDELEEIEELLNGLMQSPRQATIDGILQYASASFQR